MRPIRSISRNSSSGKNPNNETESRLINDSLNKVSFNSSLSSKSSSVTLTSSMKQRQNDLSEVQHEDRLFCRINLTSEQVLKEKDNLIEHLRLELQQARYVVMTLKQQNKQLMQELAIEKNNANEMRKNIRQLQNTAKANVRVSQIPFQCTKCHTMNEQIQFLHQSIQKDKTIIQTYEEIIQKLTSRLQEQQNVQTARLNFVQDIFDQGNQINNENLELKQKRNNNVQTEDQEFGSIEKKDTNALRQRKNDNNLNYQSIDLKLQSQTKKYGSISDKRQVQQQLVTFKQQLLSFESDMMPSSTKQNHMSTPKNKISIPKQTLPFSSNFFTSTHNKQNTLNNEKASKHSQKQNNRKPPAQSPYKLKERLTRNRKSSINTTLEFNITEISNFQNSNLNNDTFGRQKKGSVLKLDRKIYI